MNGLQRVVEALVVEALRKAPQAQVSTGRIQATEETRAALVCVPSPLVIPLEGWQQQKTASL